MQSSNAIRRRRLRERPERNAIDPSKGDLSRLSVGVFCEGRSGIFRKALHWRKLCENCSDGSFELKSSLSCGSLRLHMSFASNPTTWIPLSRLPSGRAARVSRLEGEAGVCQRLREIGFCESAVISRVGGEHALVCQVCGTRVALHRLLAERIHVEPLEGTA